MNYACPFCDGQVAMGKAPKRVVCPFCGAIFYLPARAKSNTEWILGVVAILVITSFVL